DNSDETPNLKAPFISVNGFGSFGGAAGQPRAFHTTRYQATDNVSVTRGAHRFRVGFDFNLNQLQQEREDNIQGRYDFRSLNDYLAGKIDRFRQTVSTLDPSALVFRGTQREVAFFLQDRIAVSRAVMLTAGFRWEGLWNPQPNHPNPAVPSTGRIPNDLAQWQPRAAVAWDVGGRGHTVVRLSSGIYAARTPGNLLQRVFTDNGLTTVAVDTRFDPSVLGLLHFPDPLTGVPPNLKIAAPRVFGFEPGFRNPRSLQAAATLEQDLGHSLSLSASYIHNSTWNLQRRVDRNLFPPTFDATGMPIFPKTRPNPSLGWLSINESSAHSSYDAMVLNLTRRFGRRFQLQAGYTLAYDYDDDSNERLFRQEPALDPFDLSLE